MSRQLRVLPAVDEDLAEARDWYDKRREGLGQEFLAQVDAAIEFISVNPELRPAEFRSVRRAKVRRFPYIVYYRIVEPDIEVLAILHGRRNPRVWRSRA